MNGARPTMVQTGSICIGVPSSVRRRLPSPRMSACRARTALLTSLGSQRKPSCVLFSSWCRAPAPTRCHEHGYFWKRRSQKRRHCTDVNTAFRNPFKPHSRKGQVFGPQEPDAHERFRASCEPRSHLEVLTKGRLLNRSMDRTGKRSSDRC
jgi:hypothetical protein